MNRLKLSKKIFAVVSLLVSLGIIFPHSLNAQTLSNPLNVTSDSVSRVSDINSFDLNQNVESCMQELVTGNLITSLSNSTFSGLTDGLISNLVRGVGGSISDVLGGIDLSGGISNLRELSLVNINQAIGANLPSFESALGTLNSTLGGIGGGAGGTLGSIGGVLSGGGEVPVNDGVVRTINQQISQTNQGILQDTTNLTNKETGVGGISLDAIAVCLASKTIGGILEGTIDWINTGFDGNPVFVDDPAKFFGDIADYELGLFVDDLTGGILCDHLSVSVTTDLVNNYTNQKFGRPSRCTLSDVSENVRAFADGDFSAGGWDAFLEYTQNPYNNSYGARITAQSDLDSRISRSQALAEWELDKNDGYLSIRNPETGEITTPGSIVKSQVENRLNAPINRLTFADEFDEIMNSMVNQFIKISIGELFE